MPKVQSLIFVRAKLVIRLVPAFLLSRLEGRGLRLEEEEGGALSLDRRSRIGSSGR